MSFVQRELGRLHNELSKIDENSPVYAQLYSAQQALWWALEPAGVKSPCDFIMDIPAKTGDCLSEPHPPQSSGTFGHCA